MSMSESFEQVGTWGVSLGVPLACAFVASHILSSLKLETNGKSWSEYNWVNTSGIVVAALAGAYLITPFVLDRLEFDPHWRWS